MKSIGCTLLLACATSWSQATLPREAHTSDGLQLSGPALTLRIDALRDDVLRVRVYPNGHPAEDASWAVLASARTAQVKVAPEADGFHTAALRVRLDAQQRLTIEDRAGHVLEQAARPTAWTGDGFTVSEIKDENAHFFGLGDKPGPLDRAGQSFVMWNTDNFGWQESTDPIYKSIPFFLEMHGGRTIGVLFDNTYRTYFDFGHQRGDRYSFSAPAGPCDYYVMYGPEPRKVVEDYAWLTGPTPLPPRWALGYQQSRWSYAPEAQVEEIAAKLRSDRIPADVIWLDIDYQDRYRPFTIDSKAFPDFTGMVHRLSAEHLHTVAITDLHIANAANQGYAPYDSGIAGDHFVKRAGTPYVGDVWPGPAVFPEFTRAATRAWWGTLYKQLIDAGVAGFWNDMNEPAVFRYPSKTMPDDVEHRIDEPGFAPRIAMHPEIHNVYGMENARATMDAQLHWRPKERPFVMTRASYAGGQRYSATWTGDNSSTWNHLRQTTPQLLNLGLSGFALSGADVGGFAGSPPPDLLTRWMVIAAFQPIDRNHASKGTRQHEPWVDGPEHEAIRRRFIEERYRLMDYLYTAAETTSRTGLPITRPLFLEFPHATPDDHPLDSDAGGEFMFGPDLLIAASPSPEEVNPYEVHLPPGVWYDYWTGARYDVANGHAVRDAEVHDAATASKPLMATPKLDALPIYARGGSILPVTPLTQSTDEKPVGPLTLRVYPPAPGEPCESSVYADDGHSLAYTQGEFLRMQLTCRVDADGSVTVNIKPEGHFVPWWSALRVELVSSAPIASVQVNGRAAAKAANAAAVEVPFAGKAIEIRFAVQGR